MALAVTIPEKFGAFNCGLVRDFFIAWGSLENGVFG